MRPASIWSKVRLVALLASVAITAACATTPSHPPVVTPPSVGPGAADIHVTVNDAPALAGVVTHLGATACPETTDDGTAYCTLPPGEYIATFDGIDPAVYEPADSNDQITVNIQTSVNTRVDVPLKTLRPIAHESGQLHTWGLDFYTERNEPWLFKGYATYTLISDVSKGQNIGAVFDEAIDLGANTIVALGMDGSTWAQGQGKYVDPRDPNWSHWLAAIFDQAAERKLRVYLAVFQQAQILSDAERQVLWQQACDVSRGRWNVMLSLGNEDNMNHWRHDEFPRCNGDMGGVLLSTGSRGINNPPTPPNWDFAVWESRRGPFKKAMDDAGAGAWEMYEGYPDFPAVAMPIVVIEPPFFYEEAHDWYGDDRWFEPWKALRLGLNIGGNFAGGTYGSSRSLEAQPNGPIATECGRQFYRGLTAAFLR